MPLLKIETRPKPAPEETSGPSARPPARPPSRPPARRPGADDRTESSALPALMAGAVFALVLVAGATFFLLYRNGRLGGAAALPAASSAGQAATGAPSGTGPTASGGVSGTLGSGAPAPSGPINPDYPREAVVAVVNGESIHMADLESAVRIAHALGALTGDKIPAYDDARGMKEFQVRMLRRQVDTVLMRQAFEKEAVKDPGGDATQLIDGFLARVGVKRDQLDALAAANGVSQPELIKWFAESRKVNLYVQEKLFQGTDAAKRDAAVKAWLLDAWKTNQIEINFYDPTGLIPNLTPQAPEGGARIVPSKPITP